MNKRNKNLTEDDLASMLQKNKHLKIHEPNKIQINKTSHHCSKKDSIYIPSKKQKRVNENVDFEAVYESIDSSRYIYQYNDNSLLIVFYGCRVLSLNQMMSYLQVKPVPFHMMKYKSLWHSKMKTVIEDIVVNSLTNNTPLPNFSDPNKTVKLEIFRQSSKTLDEDSIASSFKYIIDSLREKHNVLGKDYQIIPDDNQQYISTIIPYQNKDKNNIIAIKLTSIDKILTVKTVEELFLSPIDLS